MPKRTTRNVYSYDSVKHGTLWRARYISPSNRVVEKRGFLTQAEAEAWLTTEKSKLITGEWTDPRKAAVTVGSLAPAWLDVKRRTLKPSAYKPLEASWRIHVAPRWERVPLRRVVNGDIAAWLSEINRSPSIVHRAYGVLNGILKQAVKDGRLARNPAAGVDSLPRRRTRRMRRYLTQEELHRVADASGSHRSLVLTLGYCGLRWGEAIALKVGDVDFERRRITVQRSAVEVHGEIHLSTPKTDASTRLVPLPAIVIDSLRAEMEGRHPTDLVFPGSDGDYMRRVRASAGSKSWWKSALKAAGVETMVIHDLRHTAASIAVNAGGNVKSVQRMLGHASAAMTLDCYADLFDDGLDRLLDQIDGV
jgi:integrase